MLKSLGLMTLGLSLFLIRLANQAQAASAQDIERHSKLLEGAKQEKELDIWSTGDVRAQAMIIEQFKKKYPFIAEVRSVRPQPAPMRNRLLAERRAGKESDVDVLGSNMDLMAYLAEEGFLTQYKSPEVNATAEEFRDPGSRWAAFFVNPLVTAYNTKLVMAKDLPRRWEDFLHPKWRGKIAMYKEEYGWFSNFLKGAGQEKGLLFMRQLAKQSLQLRDGYTLMAQLLAAGEFPLIAVTFAPRVSLMKAEGAPVDWIALDPVFAQGITIGIYSKARHPNAAKLYVDYMLSREVQQEIWVNQFWKHSARGDVIPKDPRWKGVKVIPLDLSFTKQLGQVAAQFREIFEAQSARQ